MKKTEEKVKKSPARIIWGIITTVLTCAVVLVAVLLVGVRLFGLRPFCILSGSMEPTYHVGSLIYVKDVPPEEIEIGDPITFVLNEDLVIATHRVIDIDAENQQFYTKGDANDAPDGSPVHFNNLLGRPVFSIPYLGYVSNYLSSPPGMYVGICGAVVVILLLFIPDIIKASDKKKPAEAASAPSEAAAPAGPASPEPAELSVSEETAASPEAPGSGD